MAGRSSKNKGANGEREVAELIYYATGLVVKRNLEQTRNGGHDLVGVPGVAIEVKRQERLSLPAWWRQTIEQAEKVKAVPVLAYRQNRKPWTFVVGHEKAEMAQKEFLLWVKARLASSVGRVRGLELIYAPLVIMLQYT